MYIKPKFEAITTIPMFANFSGFVLKNQSEISTEMFSREFTTIQRKLFSTETCDAFCHEADMLATKLIANENHNFAGIIYSALCKLTEYMPDKLEIIAKKGYELAKEKGDYVHMMARLNNLRKVYYRRPDKVYEYVQVLYKQEKCLKELTYNYETAASAYSTVIRKPAPREDYEQMLAYVQTEIGKLTRKKHPNDAFKKLLSARKIFEKYNNQQSIAYIDLLIGKIQKDTVVGN